MKKLWFLTVAGLYLLAACNNSKKDEGKKEEQTVSADTSHKMPMQNVPELPAVPAGSKVEFKSPANNATVSSPFKIEMNAVGIRVDTAGPVIPGVGHHHLIVDAEDFLPTGEMTPKDSTHIHFGKGQTEYTISLPPGKHKLALQFADGLHRSYGQQLSATITVNVKK
ncbi:MAG TPA: DUF4399 domain-containing protein [Chitinophagaceae bacterium]|nr:DUF4399 domain-containing protein [Chitinophagaceae bacterium]